MLKQISELNIDDFITHPVWTWAEENDERLVKPLKDINEDHDALFIVTNFILSDGSKIPGFIAVRARDFSLYSIALTGKNNQLFDIPLQLELRRLINAHKIEEELDKKMIDVFPIRYEASLTSDKKLTGYIENLFI
jgi:hypothetical protein